MACNTCKNQNYFINIQELVHRFHTLKSNLKDDEITFKHFYEVQINWVKNTGILAIIISQSSFVQEWNLRKAKNTQWLLLYRAAIIL